MPKAVENTSKLDTIKAAVIDGMNRPEELLKIANPYPTELFDD